MTPVPKLLPSYPGRQLVDGNNFLLNRFREDAGGLVIRNIMADIRACAEPPVFVFDGANANARRRKLLPSYKMRSVKALVARENLWPMLELFRSLMPFLPAVAVLVPYGRRTTCLRRWHSRTQASPGSSPPTAI